MPPRVDPRDWDRLFRPGTPRRGGPLRAFANVLLIGAVVGLLGGGAFFGLRFGLERVRASNAATAQAGATSNAVVSATRTARALEATATVTGAAATPTVPAASAPIGRGSVVSSGNLRNQPLVSEATVIGQICAGDRIDFLEQSTGADGSLWFRIRVTEVGANCTPQRVTLGSLGWASSTLLSPPESP